MGAFIRTEFDKIVLICLFAGMLFLLHHTAESADQAPEKELVQWMREVSAGVLGALLGLIRGSHTYTPAPEPPKKPDKPDNPDNPEDK